MGTATAKTSAAPIPAPERPAISELDPDTMTLAEANRAKAVENARLARIKRERAQLEADIERGKYIDIDVAGAELDNFIAGIVSGIEGIPARLAQAVPGIQPAVVDAVRRLLDDVRRELATAEAANE